MLQEPSDPGGYLDPHGTIQFRPIALSDLEKVLAIERASFSSPWSSRFFLEEIRSPHARSLLAQVGETIVGYTIYWLLPAEVDVHNLAVHPSYRRKGIGRSLLRAVISEASRRSVLRVTLEVRKSNQAAQRLYQSLGFVGRGVRKGYYSDDGEDALLMVLELEGG